MKNKIFGFILLGAVLGMLTTSCASLPKPGATPPAPPGAPARP